MNDRKAFLLEMYRQMFSDIDRHITVVWQSISVVVGAFAILSLSEKGILPIDLATSIIVVLCGWLFAHMLDAGYWYNRNLAIISNIERQFLLQSDLRNIQYYFGLHRSKRNKMISHLRIQAALGVGLAALILLFHGFVRVLPGVHEPMSSFEPIRALPYATAFASWAFCWWFSKDRTAAYETFVTNSPGKLVNVRGINFGPGHTVD